MTKRECLDQNACMHRLIFAVLKVLDNRSSLNIKLQYLWMTLHIWFDGIPQLVFHLNVFWTIIGPTGPL